MAKANPSIEPSMEEILASIRRIIADDGAARPGAPLSVVGQAERPLYQYEDDMGEETLDQAFATAVADPDRSSGATPDPQAPAAMDRPEHEPVVKDAATGAVGEADTAAPPVAAPAAEERRRPMSDPWATAATDEVHQRAAAPPVRPAEQARVKDASTGEPLVSPDTVASVNAAFGQLSHTLVSASPRTIDDVVKDLLRPMLKDWLDENLPAVVERLVRAEIERVSRGH